MIELGSLGHRPTVDLVRSYSAQTSDYATANTIAQAVQRTERQVASAIQGLLILKELEALYPERGRGRHGDRQQYRRVEK